jgi:acetolactate synthase I/II/III large subunit
MSTPAASRSTIPPIAPARRASDLLVDCLVAHGTDRVFCVPGESYLSVLDALHERNDIQTIVCRHEGGAGLMAVADAKLTHAPGIAFVSRGPGATNASIAVHLAEQDAVPMILFIGQVPRHEIGRGAFQEVDYGKTFADMAKMVATVEDAGRLPEVIARAYTVAQSPTPGPVVIVLPEDMLEDLTTAPVQLPAPLPRLGAGSAADVEAVRNLIARAERPLLVAGGGLTRPAGRAALLAAATALNIPVALTFKRQELFPNDHPLYAGHLGFKIPKPQVDLYANTDLVIAVGTRLGEVPTQGYTFPQAPTPTQPLIHIVDDARHLGRNFRTELPIVADPTAFLNALVQSAKAQSGIVAAEKVASEPRQAWTKLLHHFVSSRRRWTPPKDGTLDMGAIITALQGQATDDGLFITDAGNFSGWLHKHWAFNGRQRAIGSVGGAMGLAMPAAVAAGLRLPQTQVITFIGDGGALMTGSELATAMQYGVGVKVFIANNGTYGTIRMHQEKAYKHRVNGTALTNPDFAKWAESFGALGLTIRTPAEAVTVVAQALAHNGPVVVDCIIPAEHIAPGLTITELTR